jgi:hypothetical protein
VDHALLILAVIAFIVAFAVSFSSRYADWTLRLIALGLTFAFLPTVI